MVSMKDIAQEVNVSRTTVSFVLNGRHNKDMKISDDTVRKIQEAAERLGYFRNELVNSVVTGKSRIISIISACPDYMMPTIRGCTEEAFQHGYIINLIPLDADVNKSITRAVEFRADGIFAISLPEYIIEQVNPKLLNLGIPSIGLTPGTGYMSFDQKNSARRGTEYLWSSGHRNIVFIGGSSHISRQREAGYREVMTAKGAPPVVRLIGGENQEEFRHVCGEIMEMRPDAVQCYNDPFAMKLANECYRRRIFIPETFSLIGFGNLPVGRIAVPTLTTIDEPYYETGRIMFQRIYELITTGAESSHELLIGEVVERESVMDRAFCI